VTSASASFMSAISSVGPSSLLQSAYSVQMLALTRNLSSPGISALYRNVTGYLGWSILGFKEKFPLFSTTKQTVNMTEKVLTELQLSKATADEATTSRGDPPTVTALPPPLLVRASRRQ
ncbi:hypothetical protein Agub_g11407, partial [Astrephomene gubernaculifera]